MWSSMVKRKIKVLDVLLWYMVYKKSFGESFCQLQDYFGEGKAQY
jgi:hypothetical protein